MELEEAHTVDDMLDPALDLLGDGSSIDLLQLGGEAIRDADEADAREGADQAGV